MHSSVEGILLLAKTFLLYFCPCLHRKKFYRLLGAPIAQQASLFDAGGKVGITEFSWNATNPRGLEQHQVHSVNPGGYPALYSQLEVFIKRTQCESDYDVPNCWLQEEWSGISPVYMIPR